VTLRASRSLPLSHFSSRDLRQLLDEEAAHWEEELLWDYSEVSDAVASGIDRKALTGRVLEDAHGPAAYCYYIQEGGRAVVGSLFARRSRRERGYEGALLDDVLGEALAASENDRVECQTLFSTSAAAEARFERAGFSSRARHYLVLSLDSLEPAPAPPPPFRPIKREDFARVADIIYRSHKGSLDAALNMTYGSPAHCRHFVETLVMRGGCGRFEPEASFVAEEAGRPIGVLIASRLSPSNGHICQVSVSPDGQGRGLGSSLVRAALASFRRQGLRSASLSVTVENRRAYQLYERLGFRLRKAFAAHAWVRPPARIELPA
jgi:ribosomal protein S18 acetylase RimI-like enzyme